MPELEAVEVNLTNIFFDCYVVTSLFSKKVPDSLKTMIEGLRKMEEEGDDEVDLARPRSGAREPKEEFPRPLSQVKPPILPPLVIDVVTFLTFTHVLVGSPLGELYCKYHACLLFVL